MFLRGEKIFLREFLPNDFKAYFEIAHSDSVRRYIRYCYTETLEESVKAISDLSNCNFTDNFYFAICEMKTGKIIGAVLTFRMFSLVLETCCFISEQYRNHGYCTEALQLLIDYLESNTVYRSLFFNVLTDNKPSQSVLKKLGFHIGDNQEYFTYSLKRKK